jgi:hypothetical protein
MAPDTDPGGLALPDPPVGLTTSYIVELSPAAAEALFDPLVRVRIAGEIDAIHPSAWVETIPPEAILIMAIEAGKAERLLTTRW